MFGASLAMALVVAAIMPAAAAGLPEVKVSDANQVPACATPGRLMAYLHQRNPRMNERFDKIAAEYMRLGEQLGIRWDMAFFQMILETGALSYTGDVRADQNNFAGLGASGNGKHGERFADVSSGVKAHLQHLLMYAGEHIDDPVAERTRKVQEWGVLTDWQHSIKGPMTFTLVAKQWAPGSRRYVRDIAAIAEGFYDGVCNGPDPRPELMQEAHRGRESKQQTQVAELAPESDVDTSAREATATPMGSDVGEDPIEQARKEDPPRRGLGADGMLGSVTHGTEKARVAKAAATSPETQPGVALINPSKSQTIDTAETQKVPTPPTAKPDTDKEMGDMGKTVATSDMAMAERNETTAASAAKPDADTSSAHEDNAIKDNAIKGAQIQTAAVAGTATQLKVPSASAPAKCRVWTASYGGQRAVLIKAISGGTVNYTVLDVNEANEKREVDAYIAAYAKGGQRVAAFPNQTQALDQAFMLCPEG
jgi:hypothetical protein